MSHLTLGKELRKQFPIFNAQLEFGRPLHYLDSAASAQKPAIVIDRISRYLSHEHANIHRGAYALSARATELYDEARESVATFLSVPARNIIFTRGATEAINLVSYALSDYFVSGDSILLTILEHHSNIVPWQLLASRKNLSISFADCNPDATVNLSDFVARLAQKPKLVAMSELTNSFGTLTPIRELVSEAQRHGALTLVDACQSIVHGTVGPKELGCDFFCFSGHKLYGPTGIGVCYASDRALELMEPFNGGGDMIEQVTVEGSTWAQPPQKFEAGTPAIAEAVGLGEAIRFFEQVQKAGYREHEQTLLSYAVDKLSAINGVTLYGPAAQGKEGQRSIQAFNVDGVHPHDLATICDEHGVQFRAGHHCAMPALRRLGLQSTARVSFGAYSDIDDVEALVTAIKAAKKLFS